MRRTIPTAILFILLAASAFALNVTITPPQPTADDLLTVSTTPETNIINWYKNGENYNKVNIPFENSLTDYASNLSGTGMANYVSGFDGNTAVKINKTGLKYGPIVTDSSFTLSLWAKAEGYSWILQQYEKNTCQEFMNLYYNSTHVIFQIRDTEHNTDTVSAPANLDSWTHITVKVWENVELFINGTKAASTKSTQETHPLSGDTITILGEKASCGCNEGKKSIVSLHDLQVLRTVSDEQISILSQGSHSIAATETSQSDTWKACATISGSNACNEVTVRRDSLPGTAILYPAHQTRVPRDQPFRLTARVTCEGNSPCENIQAILDPMDGSDGYYTDDPDCAQSTMCDYTYSGECNTNYCGVNDGCDCWWPEYDYSGQSCCGGEVYGPGDGGTSCEATTNIIDSPDPYSYSSNTLTEQCWLIFSQPSKVFDNVVVSYDWDTDSYPEEGSFWIKSPAGTVAKIGEGEEDGTYKKTLGDFEGESSQGNWELWIADSYGDGGHQVKNLNITFEKKIGVYARQVTKRLITKGTQITLQADIYPIEPVIGFNATVQKPDNTTEQVNLSQNASLIQGTYTLPQYGNYNATFTLTTQNYTYQDTISFTTSQKGIIPQGSGTPFYTEDENIKNSSHVPCLARLEPGESCYVSWEVVPTGWEGSWEFFVDFLGSNQQTTGIIEIIIDPEATPDENLTPPCFDGTEEGQCSISGANACVNGELQEKCTQCGCPQDKRCMDDPADPDYNKCICKDECIEGARMCVRNGISTCGNHDADRCLDWSEPVECFGAMECSDGYCGYNGTIERNEKSEYEFVEKEAFLFSPTKNWKETLPWASTPIWQEYNESKNDTDTVKYDVMMYHDETGFRDFREFSHNMSAPNPISQLPGPGIECGAHINFDGIYTLQKDLTPLDAPENRNEQGLFKRECIFIEENVKEVVIDCQGHTIDCGSKPRLELYTTRPDDDYYCYNQGTGEFITFPDYSSFNGYQQGPNEHCGQTPSTCKDKDITQCAQTRLTCAIVQGSNSRHPDLCGQAYDYDALPDIKIQNCNIINCKEINLVSDELVMQGNQIEVYDELGNHSKAYWTLYANKSANIFANIFTGRGDLRLSSRKNSTHNISYNKFDVEVQDVLRNDGMWYSGNNVEFNMEIEGVVNFHHNYIDVNTTSQDKYLEENKNTDGFLEWAKLGEGYNLHIWGKSRGAGKSNISDNIWVYDVSPVRWGIDGITLPGAQDAIIRNNLFWVKQHPLNVSLPEFHYTYFYTNPAGSFIDSQGCQNCTITGNVMYFQGIRKNDAQNCSEVFGKDSCDYRIHGSQPNGGYAGFILSELNGNTNNNTKVYNNYFIMDGYNKAPALIRGDSGLSPREYNGMRIKNYSVFIAMDPPEGYDDNGTIRYRARNDTYNYTRPAVLYDGYPGHVYGHNYSREVTVQNIPLLEPLNATKEGWNTIAARGNEGLNIVLLNNSNGTAFLFNYTADGLTLQSGNSSKIVYNVLDPLQVYDYLTDNATILPILGLSMKRRFHYTGGWTNTHVSVNLTIPQNLVSIRYNSTGSPETYNIAPQSMQVYSLNKTLLNKTGTPCNTTNISIVEDDYNITYVLLDHEIIEYVIKDLNGTILAGPTAAKSPKETLCCRRNGTEWNRTCAWQNWNRASYQWENRTIALNFTGITNITLAVFGEEAGYDIDSTLFSMNRSKPRRLSILQNTPKEVFDVLNRTFVFNDTNLRKLKTKQYFSFWTDMSTVVWSEDDYEKSLHAATFASYINAPLVIENSLNKTEQQQYLSTVKKVICIGEPEDAPCSETYTIAELQKEYMRLVNKTTGVVIVNPRDQISPTFGTILPDIGGKPITKLHYQLSALGPVLAAGKEWLLMTDKNSNPELIIENVKTRLEEVNEPEVQILGIAPVADTQQIDYLLPGELNLTPIGNKSRIAPRVDRVSGITVSDASASIRGVLSNNDTVMNGQFAQQGWFDTTNRYADKLSAPTVENLLGGITQQIIEGNKTRNDSFLLIRGSHSVESSDTTINVTDCPIIVTKGDVHNISQEYKDAVQDKYGCYATISLTGLYVTHAYGKLLFTDDFIRYEALKDKALLRRVLGIQNSNIESLNIESSEAGPVAEVQLKHSADLMDLTEYLAAGSYMSPWRGLVQRGSLNFTVESNGTNSRISSPVEFIWEERAGSLKHPGMKLSTIDTTSTLYLVPKRSVRILIGNASQYDQSLVMDVDGISIANYTSNETDIQITSLTPLVLSQSMLEPATDEETSEIYVASLVLRSRRQFTEQGYAKDDQIVLNKTPQVNAQIFHIEESGRILLDTDADGIQDQELNNDALITGGPSETVREQRTEIQERLSLKAESELQILAYDSQDISGLMAEKLLFDLYTVFPNFKKNCTYFSTHFWESETLKNYRNQTGTGDILASMATTAGSRCFDEQELMKAYHLYAGAETLTTDPKFAEEMFNVQQKLMSHFAIQLAKVEAHEIYRLAYQYFYPDSVLGGSEFYEGLVGKPWYDQALAGLSSIAPWNIVRDHYFRDPVQYSIDRYQYELQASMHRFEVMQYLINKGYAKDVAEAREIVQMATDQGNKRNPGSYLNDVWELQEESMLIGPNAFMFRWEQLPLDYWYSLSTNIQGTEGWLRDKSNTHGLDYNGYFNGTHLYMVEPINYTEPLEAFNQVPEPLDGFSGYVLFTSGASWAGADVSTIEGIHLLNESEFSALQPCMNGSQEYCEMHWKSSQGSEQPMRNETGHFRLNHRTTPYQLLFGEKWIVNSSEDLLGSEWAYGCEYQKVNETFYVRNETSTCEQTQYEYEKWFEEKMTLLTKTEMLKAYLPSLSMAHINFPVFDPLHLTSGSQINDPRGDTDVETIKIEPKLYNTPEMMSGTISKAVDLVRHQWRTPSNLTTNISFSDEEGQELLLNYAEDKRYEHGNLETAVLVSEVVLARPANSDLGQRAQELKESVVDPSMWQSVKDIWNYHPTVVQDMLASLTNPFEWVLWHSIGVRIARIAPKVRMAWALKTLNFVRELPSRAWGVRILASQMNGVPVKFSLRSVDGARNIAAMGTLIATDIGLDAGAGYVTGRAATAVFGQETGVHVAAATMMLTQGFMSGAEEYGSAVARVRNALKQGGNLQRYGAFYDPATGRIESVYTHTDPIDVNELKLVEDALGGKLTSIEEAGPGMISVVNKVNGEAALPMRLVHTGTNSMDNILRNPNFISYPTWYDHHIMLAGVKKAHDAQVSLLNRQWRNSLSMADTATPEKRPVYTGGEIVEYIDHYGQPQEGLIQEVNTITNHRGAKETYAYIFDPVLKDDTVEVDISQIRGRKQRLSYTQKVEAPDAEYSVVDVLASPHSLQAPIQVALKDGRLFWLKNINNPNAPDTSQEFVQHAFVKTLSESEDWPVRVEVPEVKRLSDVEFAYELKSPNPAIEEDFADVKKKLAAALEDPENHILIEHTPGYDFKDYLDMTDNNNFETPLPPEAINDLRQALYVMHQNGVTHSDLHMGNAKIKFDENGNHKWVLMDLGNAVFDTYFQTHFANDPHYARALWLNQIARDLKYVSEFYERPATKLMKVLPDQEKLAEPETAYLYTQQFDVCNHDGEDVIMLKRGQTPLQIANMLEATRQELDAFETMYFGSP